MRHGATAPLPARARRVGRPVRLSVAVSLSFLAGGLVAVAPPASAAGEWSVVANPNPVGGQSSGLNAVSCPTVSRCFAVGASGDHSILAEHWNGTSWSVVPGGAGLTGTESPSLVAVACASATSCFAVGDYYYPPFPPNAVAVRPLVEHWNGTRWSVMTRPVPAGARDAVLSGVSCHSTTSCFAVGYYARPGAGVQTLVERWNGSRWSVMKSANWSVSFLTGVWCPGAASCYAVGGVSNSTTVDPTAFVEHWNGTSWSIVPSPDPTRSTQSALARVSCPSTDNCFAVGESSAGEMFKTLVEHWNGTRWSIMTSPNPAAKQAFLSSVSCPSTTSCDAVGYYYAGRATRTLVEHWNGASWSITATPNPSGAAHAELNGVSCHSPSSCFAVGSRGNARGDGTLIERRA